MILMGNSKVVWEGEGCKAFPYPDSVSPIKASCEDLKVLRGRREILAEERSLRKEHKEELGCV